MTFSRRWEGVETKLARALHRRRAENSTVSERRKRVLHSKRMASHRGANRRRESVDSRRRREVLPSAVESTDPCKTEADFHRA